MTEPVAVLPQRERTGQSPKAPDRRAGRGRHRRTHGTGPANARLMVLQTNANARFSEDRPSMVAPPAPPMRLTAAVACDPQTDEAVLWHIARTAPELRRWLVANPKSSPELLEFVAQAGGPGVREAIEVLLDLLRRAQCS